MDARRNRRKKVSVGRTAESLFGAGHADETFRLVVVGRDLVVGDGPVCAQAVCRFEVVIGKSKRNASEMVRTAADDPGSEPAELIVLGDGVGFALDVTVSIRRVEVAPLLAAEIGFSAQSGSTMIHLVGQDVPFEILGRIEHRTGFEQSDVDAELGQDLNRGAAASARADDDHVGRRLTWNISRAYYNSREPAVRKLRLENP